MARAISVRLDDEADHAMQVLEATGLAQSEAIRSSLVAAAQRTRDHPALVAEVGALEADDDDRHETMAVASGPAGDSVSSLTTTSRSTAPASARPPNTSG